MKAKYNPFSSFCKVVPGAFFVVKHFSASFVSFFMWCDQFCTCIRAERTLEFRIIRQFGVVSLIFSSVGRRHRYFAGGDFLLLYWGFQTSVP